MSVGSFLWGSGGRRMTPEDIVRERAAAAQRMRTDYSPIQSPWQGFARVADNLMGAIDSRRADSASTRNAEDQRRIIAAMMTPGGGISEAGATTPPIAGGSPAMAPLDAGPTGMGQVSETVGGLSDVQPTPTTAPGAAATPGRPPINPAIIEAITSPYVSDEVRALAVRQYTEATRRREPLVVNGHVLDPLDPTRQIADYSEGAQPEIVRLVRATGIDPASPEGMAMVRRYTENRTDPVVSIPLPDGRTYIGPRSGMSAALHTLGSPGGGPPATLPPDFEFPEEGGPTPNGSGDFPW